MGSSSSTVGGFAIPNAVHTVSVGKVSFDGAFLRVPVSMAHSGVVSVRLYSALGSEVVSANRLLSAGQGDVLISRKNISSGVYMISVVTASSHIVQRVNLQ